MRWLLGNLIYLIRWVWQDDLNRVEAALIVAVLGAAAIGWRFVKVERIFAPMASRQAIAVLATGIAALVARAMVLPVLPIPAPLITDEFSHLLLADTLMNGRLANPVHPMWRHFETIHVIQKPTYASMYLPAQGAVLALGRIVLGHPWWGVWFSNGLMCGALCWMLQQWSPPGWALFGGALAVLRFSIFSYWDDSYWGGSVPALGGALLIGAVGQIRKRPTLMNGLVFGAGAIVLLYSRPFEGIALCAAGFCLCWRQCRSNAAVAAAFVILMGAAGLSYYCYRITGSATKLPYQVNQQAYGWPMTLLWYQPHASGAEPKQMREYYEWELSQHSRNFLDSTIEKGQFLWGFFLGPCLTIPLFFLKRDKRVRPALIMGGAVLAAVLVEQTAYPHYFSPATGALLILVVQGVRHLRQTRLGCTYVQLLPVMLVLTLAVRMAAAPLGFKYSTLARRLSWCCEVAESEARAEFKQRLEKLPGGHLVIVHYGPAHPFSREWVYNDASIDASKIVWARDMGVKNEELLKYFKDRRVWNVQVDN